MSTLSYPTTKPFTPSEFTLTLQRNIVGKRRNPFSGRRQTIEHPGPLWVATIVYTPSSHDDRAEVEAFWNLASAATNKVALWHFVRPLPRGTLQANTTSGAGSLGASTININATTGLTLKAGDMVSFAHSSGAKQLCMVTADVTSVSGVMTAVPFVPALTGAVSNGAAVTVNKPTALFQPEETFVSMPYVPGYAQSFPVVLIESPEW